MLSRSRISIAAVFLFALALVAVSSGPALATAAAKPAAGASEARPIDLNTADGPALESVPGIGKSLAQRIVAFREKNGSFQSVDDLLKVQGIGEKSIQKLRPYFTVVKGK